MKIKVGHKIYDGEVEPVMAILTDQDKENIKNMHPGCMSYCVYPEIEPWTDPNAVEVWMKSL